MRLHDGYDRKFCKNLNLIIDKESAVSNFVEKLKSTNYLQFNSNDSFIETSIHQNMMKEPIMIVIRSKKKLLKVLQYEMID